MIACQKFAQYIRMLYPGRFILIESVKKILKFTFLGGLTASSSHSFSNFLILSLHKEFRGIHSEKLQIISESPFPAYTYI